MESESKYDCLKIGNQLCFPLYAVSKEIIKKYKKYLDPLDLTYTQYITMMIIWDKKVVSSKEIGNELYLDSGTLTPLLKKLEQKGYIERKRQSDDERNLTISITEKGIKLQDEALNIPSEMSKDLNLTEDEILTLYKILYKMID